MNKAKKITTLILVLALICTMLPTQAFAASKPKITPSGSILLTVGKKITIKPSGTYKKVTYKSSNIHAATVSKKGVVKAVMKMDEDGFIGTGTLITATFTLKNNKTVERYLGIDVVFPTVIKLTEVNDASVQKVMKALESGKAFNILVKGKTTSAGRASAIETVEALKKQIGYANEYGVRFQYDDDYINSCDEGYLFYVMKDDCEMYNLSLSFYKKIVPQAISHIFPSDSDALAFARSFDTWEAYAAGLDANDIQGDDGFTYNPYRLNGYWENDRENVREGAEDWIGRAWLLANKKFCDLSPAMQVWVVSESRYFIGDEIWVKFGYMGIVQGKEDNLRGKSALQQMRLMENNTAKAKNEISIAAALGIALSQLDIRSRCNYKADYYDDFFRIYPVNADGQELVYTFYRVIRGDSYESDCSPLSLIY